jgi:hypothetical protein
LARKELPSLNESAMETALRRLKELAERFERYKEKTELQDKERQKERGLIASELAHVLMMAVNWDTIAQMDPLGMSRVIAVIPAGTWTAVFKRAERSHLRKLLMGLSGADYDVLAELLGAYDADAIADTLRSSPQLADKLVEAIGKAQAKWSR